MILKPAVLISSRYLYLKIRSVQDTKLTFTEEEMEAIMNRRFFLVKEKITGKVQRLFAALERELLKRTPTLPFLSENGLQLKERGKIFKGENYRSLPYLILDCPRVFNTKSVFAYR